MTRWKDYKVGFVRFDGDERLPTISWLMWRFNMRELNKWETPLYERGGERKNKSLNERKFECILVQGFFNKPLQTLH